MVAALLGQNSASSTCSRRAGSSARWSASPEMVATWRLARRVGGPSPVHRACAHRHLSALLRHIHEPEGRGCPPRWRFACSASCACSTNTPALARDRCARGRQRRAQHRHSASSADLPCSMRRRLGSAILAIEARRADARTAAAHAGGFILRLLPWLVLAYAVMAPIRSHGRWRTRSIRSRRSPTSRISSSSRGASCLRAAPSWCRRCHAATSPSCSGLTLPEIMLALGLAGAASASRPHSTDACAARRAADARARRDLADRAYGRAAAGHVQRHSPFRARCAGHRRGRRSPARG